MRLAVISDIHGNLPALDAVIADLERRGVRDVIHGGDLALGGCQPAEVIDRLREIGWPGVLGNDDQLLWAPDERARQLRRSPKLAAVLSNLFDQYAPATREIIGQGRLGWLRSLPRKRQVDGLTVLHASPDDLWRAPMCDAADGELTATYGRLGAAIVVYGHVHRPYVRELSTFAVANSGSVGSPRDGDPRASYVLIEGGSIEIVRVDYDIEREIWALRRSGYPNAERIARARRGGSAP